MKQRTAETFEVIEAIASDLVPVRRIPPLHRSAVAVALLWAVIGGAALAAKGLRPDVAAALLESRGFVAILTGLVLVGAGGVGAALAGSVPGREVAARRSLATGLVGAILCVGVGAVLVLRGGAPLVPAASLGSDASCLTLALLLALPPAVGVLLFSARAAPHRRLLVALFASAGTVALGAVVVHLSCDCIHPRHLILSHALAPVAGALLLTLPYRSALLRVESARSERTSRPGRPSPGAGKPHPGGPGPR